MSILLPRGDHEARLVEEAIAALRQGAGLDASLISIERNLTGDQGYDARIDVMVDGEPRRYVVECKITTDRRAHAQQTKQKLQAIPEAGLLIAPYVSRELAHYCREIDLQFIDTHGNAFLKGPGLLVFVSGQRHENGIQPMRSSGGITGLAGLRVAFTLLSKPNMVAAPYREIAGNAGVSLGAVSNAMDDLERRGYVIRSGHSQCRQLLEPQKLLDEWVLNYPIQLRPKLNVRRYSVPSPDWWKDEQLEGTGAVWGGEVAAKNLTQYLKPASQTIYIEPSERSAYLKKLVISYRAKPDPNGSLELLDKFWGEGLDQRRGIAPPALVYADLLASLDPRAGETAQLIRKNWINDSFNQA